jgi:Amt family ammonium transporter
MEDITSEMIDELLADTTKAINTAWILLNGMLVFFMQAGFASLECGSVKVQNVVTVLIQNMGTTAIVFISYFFSWGFAFGKLSNGFIGYSNFFLIDDSENYALWFWHGSFAAAACSIVSAAMLERVKAPPYLFVIAMLGTFAYPIVSHWVWSSSGFLSRSSPNNVSGGALDFAGAGVVHLFGGTASLVALYFIGPRQAAVDRKNGKLIKTPGHSLVLQGLGVIILWFGW